VYAELPILIFFDLTIMLLWKPKFQCGVKAFREGNNEAAISLFTEASSDTIEKTATHYISGY
jgi:hypothetical protein